jgi:hypothetical protein
MAPEAYAISPGFSPTRAHHSKLEQEKYAFVITFTLSAIIQHQLAPADDN